LKEARELTQGKVIEIKYGLPKLKKDENGEEIPTPTTTFQVYADRWLKLKMKKLGIGKIAVDLHVEYENGQIWHPWHGVLTRPYRFKYRVPLTYR